jgi:uncharacterized protein YdiU (UPF0061 family)
MTTQEDKRAERAARSALESIVEMVQNLDPEKAREAAAQEYANKLSLKECKKMLRKFGIECYENESLEELREAIAVNIADMTFEPEGFDFDEYSARDDAQDRIQEHPLSVEVRSGWCNSKSEMEPEEFLILLCTGGPAVRIIGRLGYCSQPDRATLEYQDWFTSWEPLCDITEEESEALLRYCQQFYFGE